MASFEFPLPQDEHVIKAEWGMFIKSNINAQRGNLALTNKRILFLQVTNFVQMLVGTINSLLGKKKAYTPAVDIKLADIQSISKGNFGRNTNVLKVIEKNGKETRVMLHSAYEQWEALINQQLSNR